MKYPKWNFKKCHNLALKCKTRSEFATKYKNAYMAARSLGILDKICSHMKRLVRKDWTFKELLAEAKKYKSRSEFQKKSNGAYQAAKLRGILDKICSHMPKRVDQSGKNGSNFKWSDKKLKEEALEYKTRMEFQFGSPSAYRTAVARGILDQICKHMKRSTGTSRPEQELFLTLKEHFPNLIKKNFNVTIAGKSHIKRFQVDILDQENGLGIEFDGKHHHSEEFLIKSKTKIGWTKKEAKNYHQIKDDALFNCHNITILHIKEQEWNKDKLTCINECLKFLRNHD